MAKQVVLNAVGGLEHFQLSDHELPPPGAGEARVRQRAAGLNFVDVYHRTGRYPLPSLPAVLGVEAVGVVDAVGAGVVGLERGQRVAYAGQLGAYCDERNVAAERLLPVPDGLSDAGAAVALARGITLQLLANEVYQLSAGDLTLIHSAAGGLGSLLVRFAKARGAGVIATVSSLAKAERVRALGADHVIVGRAADFPEEVAKLTRKRGVDVAYDGVGGTTLLKSIRSTRLMGTCVSYGQAGGDIPPLSIRDLGPRTLARPSVMVYMQDLERYRTAGIRALQAALDGLGPSVSRSYALADVARAHADLESGATTDCAVLVTE